MLGRTAAWTMAILGSSVVLLGAIAAHGAGQTASEIVLDCAIALAYLYGGLLIWRRSVAWLTGALMVFVGLTWGISVLATSENPILSGLGIGLGDTHTALLFVLVLVYPEGRFDSLWDRRAAILLALAITALNVLQLVPQSIWINDNPNGFYVGLILIAVAVTLMLRRWVVAPPRARYERMPVLMAGIVLTLTLVLNIVRRVIELPPDVASFVIAVWDAAPAAIPIALLVGFYRSNAERYRDLVETQQKTQDELRLSRARIVEATDAARRGFERDLHDGAQQRLVALSLGMRLLRTQLVQDKARPPVIEGIDAAAEELKAALSELRELARGIHPTILTEAGLAAALEALAERSPVETTLEVGLDQRLPDPIEATAYFVAAEALTNVAKHASASSARVAARVSEDVFLLSIADDGVGGARRAPGTGLDGLHDRVASLGGTLSINSSAGGGTTVTATLPLLDGWARDR